MAKERVILHCDMNCFYASCEMSYHPELQGKPIAVCGDPERRSGIVLTASYPAKRMGVKTGMPLWEAQQHCRDIIFVPAHYDLYTRFSGYTREIFLRYTDQVEPFGLDEAWLDCTASQSLFGTGERIARKISDTIKDELGITCSVGVSWNKTLAKLGSDYKKPISFDYSAEKQEEMERLEAAIDGVRNRFGYYSVQRAIMYTDKLLSHCDAKNDHTIHPHGYLQGSI